MLFWTALSHLVALYNFSYNSIVGAEKLAFNAITYLLVCSSNFHVLIIPFHDWKLTEASIKPSFGWFYGNSNILNVKWYNTKCNTFSLNSRIPLSQYWYFLMDLYVYLLACALIIPYMHVHTDIHIHTIFIHIYSYIYYDFIYTYVCLAMI